MLNFSIDISETVQEFSLAKSDIDALVGYTLDRITDEYVTQWENLINSGLDNTRDEYKRAIYTERPDNNTSIIGLNSRESKLAVMIETGADAFDEKSGFYNSNKKHVTKNGWHLTIPFRHGVSESIMEMMVPGTGVSVIDLMKTGATMGAGQLPQPFDEILTHNLQLNNGTLISYKHKAPIYEGMHRRNMNSTISEKRGGYFTFRRVSDKSDPEAWIHPGFVPHLFMDKALNLVQTGAVIDNSVQDWLDAKFG